MNPRQRKIIVQKYGGSSLAVAQDIGNVAGRICRRRDDGVDLVAVVSAMGDTTDDLIKLALDVAGPHSPPDAREMDTLLSTGELVSSTLMAMAIKARGYAVVSLSGVQAGIQTDSTHGAARIAAIDTARLLKELDAGRVIIVAGFQGITQAGDVTTLGRGGSDTTAVALAAALKAERCEIYTDVDGIYTTDPRLVPQARKLREIGYGEMLEMAALGAKMNPRSIELAAVYGVPVLVASSFTDAPGTLIHGGEHTMEVRKAVTGIAVDRNVAKITVRGVPDKPGVAHAIFQPLADAGVSIDVIIQNTAQDGLTDMTFTVSEGEFQRAREIAEKQAGLRHKGVIAQTGLAKVSIVGTGMQNAPGYAAKMFGALAEAGVNIELVTTSEIRITCLVKKEQVQAAAQALHHAFELEKPGA
jgi:aspartate kinase